MFIYIVMVGPSVSMGDWFQDTPQMPKFEDAQIPY
jgi:hypothetical protein